LHVSSTITVPGNGLTTVSPESLNPRLSSISYTGTIRVSSSSPISVVGFQVYLKGTNGYVAIPAFSELSPPATLFPHLAINGGYTASLQLIKTLDTQQPTAAVHFFSPSGSALDPKTIGFNQPALLGTGPIPY